MKNIEKSQARELRKTGLSINSITNLLKVSKSSVSLWVRDIELTPEQKEKLSYRSIAPGPRSYGAGGKAIKEKWAIIRQQQKHDGFNRAKIDKDFRIICALYWGEGHKSKCTCSISNCDKYLLKFFGNWLIEEGYSNKIRFTIAYYQENNIGYQDMLQAWRKYLSFITDDNITKPIIVKVNRASQLKRVNKQPHGTARLAVHCSKLLNEIYGGIEYLKWSVSSVEE